jgi:hypothetical protein
MDDLMAMVLLFFSVTVENMMNDVMLGSGVLGWLGVRGLKGLGRRAIILIPHIALTANGALESRF